MSDVSARNTTESGTGNTFQSLGTRARNCSGFRWLPGMLTVRGIRVVHACDGQGLVHGVSDDPYSDQDMWPLPHDAIPDLRDPCTLGGLLWLVREAEQDSELFSFRCSAGPHHGWGIESCGYYLVSGRRFETEAEALVSALEDAAEVVGWGEG